MCHVPLMKLKFLCSLNVYTLEFLTVFSFKSSSKLFQIIGPLKATVFLPISVLNEGILKTVLLLSSYLCPPFLLNSCLIVGITFSKLTCCIICQQSPFVDI